MDNFSTDFSTLEQNVRQLIEKKKEAEKELEILKDRMKSLTESLSLRETEIEELKEKNKILRIAGGQKGDNREIKLKINEMVREVDKCIAQLNQ